MGARSLRPGEGRWGRNCKAGWDDGPKRVYRRNKHSAVAFTLPTTYLTSLHTHYQLLVLLNTAADSRIKHESAGARRITLSVWVATCGDPFCERFEVYSVHLKCRNHESLLHQEETQHPRNITQVSSSRSVLTVLSSFFLRERELTTLKRRNTLS